MHLAPKRGEITRWYHLIALRAHVTSQLLLSFMGDDLCQQAAKRSGDLVWSCVMGVSSCKQNDVVAGNRQATFPCGLPQDTLAAVPEDGVS